MNPRPHRPSSTYCNRHPQQDNFTAFCPSCLCERLSSSSSSSSSFFTELRRTKSFSSSLNDTLSAAFQPQRKSCDVRASTSLFNDNKTFQNEEKHNPEEIRVLQEPDVNFIEESQEFKTMKDHIDLNSSQSKKASKDSKGSFWSAASVFRKWRQKQKTKKHHNHRNGNDDGGSATLPVEKPINRQFRDTQSEIADYGFGRRSCDTDPRFSLDIGRVSFDDPRYSFDEPRASWDGYLIGRTTTIPRMPTMLSVVEDDAPVNVLRSDAQIPVENEDNNVPGGSSQTREYYDSFSRRRKSLDRSNSIRKTVVAEMDDELKSGDGIVDHNDNTNAKVVMNHAGLDYIHGAKMGGGFVDDDCCGSETIELGFRDNGESVVENGGDMKGSKKSRRGWSKVWSIWGFINRRGGNKDEDRYGRRGNGVERSFSESWQEFRGDSNGDGGGGGAFNGRMLRSNSSVSWRNAQSIGGGSFGTLGSNGIKHGKKAKDEFVLERNRSARYSPSPNNIDNGLLRFYLNPMSGSRRNGSVKSRSNQAHSIARSVPR